MPETPNSELIKAMSVKPVLMKQTVDLNQLQPKQKHVFVKHDAVTAISAMHMVAFHIQPVFAHNVRIGRPNEIVTAIDGKAFFVPKLKIAAEDEQGFYGLRFVRTESGDVKLSLEYELDPQGITNEAAMPLQITFTEGAILFGPNAIDLPKPTIVSNYSRDLRVRFLIPIPETSLDSLVTALQSADTKSEVQLVLNFHFRRQKKSAQVKPGQIHMIDPGFVFKPTMDLRHFKPMVQPGVLGGGTQRGTPSRQPAPRTPQPLVNPRRHRAKLESSSPAMRSRLMRADRLRDLSRTHKFKAVDQPIIRKDILEALKEKQKSDKTKPKDKPKLEIVKIEDEYHQKTQIFIPESDPNFDIAFGDVQPEPQEALRQVWQTMDFGTFAPGLYPNTIYMVPHGLRIRFDPNTDLPDIQPTLFRTEEDETRVRLRIGVDPWYDAARVEELRRELSLLDSSFRMPRLVRDFTSTVSLSIDTAFRDDIALMDDIVEQELSMSAPFYLTFDLSLEFYQFVIGLLTGAVGINGSLTFKLADVSEDETGEETTVPVPFSLKLSELSPIPLRYEIDSKGDPHGRPRNIEIVNLSSHEVLYDDVMVTAFTDDENSLLPIGVIYPDIENTMPFALPPAEGAALVMERPDDTQHVQLWNALDVVLTGQRVNLDPMTAMERVQELVPPGGLTWELNLRCLALGQNPLPEAFTGLHAVQVEVTVDGRAPKTHTLTTDMPELSISVTPTFEEIMADAAQSGGLQYSYRAKSIYVFGETDWSEAKPGNSSTAFVFPSAFE